MVERRIGGWTISSLWQFPKLRDRYPERNRLGNEGQQISEIGFDAVVNPIFSQEGETMTSSIKKDSPLRGENRPGIEHEKGIREMRGDQEKWLTLFVVKNWNNPAGIL